MTRLLGFVLLFGLTAVTVTAEPLQFVDQWRAGDLPAYGQAYSGLTTLKPQGLKAELGKPASTVRYASFEFSGEKGSMRVVAAMAEPPNGAQALYVDSNADGALKQEEVAKQASADERPPGFGRADEQVWVADLSRPYSRRVAFRLSRFGGMLVCAVRGYWAGRLPVDGQPRDLVLVDANADLRLETGRDRAYVDLDGDGKLDPQSEGFALLTRMQFGQSAFSFPARMGAQQVQWEVARQGEGTLRFALGALKVKPDKLMASVSWEGGRVFGANALGQDLTVPAGSYTVESLLVRARGADGKTHTYSFDRRGSAKPIVVQANRASTADLLGKLSLAVSGFGTTQRRGGSFSVGVNLQTATGLALTSYDSGQTTEGRDSRVAPFIKFLAPDGSVVQQGSMEFG